MSKQPFYIVFGLFFAGALFVLGGAFVIGKIVVNIFRPFA